jgi:hypothetical protein
MIWTDAQVAQLQTLWRKRDAAGQPMFSREQIAEALDLKLGAVIAKLDREYKHGRLERRINNPTDGGRHRGVNQLQRAIATTDKSLAIRLATPLKPLPPPIVPASMTPIARPRTCQWPMWRHGDRSSIPPLFCGAAVLHGHAYCADHCRRAFHNWHELSRHSASGLRSE